ncbi:MAG TPA: SH3 domain-containing protein [Chloroflexia bacterium]|nr:SH3 domain-containing protein [Chloroflexia bacterium]
MQLVVTENKMPRTMLALWAALALLLASMVIGGRTATIFAATPVAVGGKAIVTNTDGDPIRIRKDAGTEFAQIGMAYQGQSVSVLDGPRSDKKGNQWFKVQAPGGTGWMSAEFLQGTSAPATATKLTGSAVVANTNGDPLRMRSAPNTSGSVLTFLNPGATVTIQSGPTTDATGIAWYKITAKGFTGWAMAKYLVQAPAATETAAKKETAAEAKPAVQTQGGATTTLGQYRQWMEEARKMYPYKQGIDKMWSVMMCESGGNARASGGGGRWLGLFQYAPGTWGGSWNPYRGNSIWDARSQIFATAKAWSIGMQSHWSCYYITPGR